MNCCTIWKKFDETNNLIKEYKYWKLLVRKNHIYLGSCIAITKRHMESFSDISDEEMKEYATVVRDIEKSLKKGFNYDAIHHLMLMMKDKHTHFHILPRYKQSRTFANIEWIDTFEPNPLFQKRTEPVSQDILDQIKHKIIENI